MTIATAEIAMLLILGAARRAPEGVRMIGDRKWFGWEPLQLLGRRLDRKRLGIYGMGRIGRALAKRARAFDMEIHYYNRCLPAAKVPRFRSEARENNNKKFSSLKLLAVRAVK